MTIQSTKGLTFGFFDIETYINLFVFVLIKTDETGKQLSIDTVSATTAIDGSIVNRIETLFKSCDYIVSFNGKNFDLPILTEICAAVHDSSLVPVKYVYSNAMCLIHRTGDDTDVENRLYLLKLNRIEWTSKHFDVLNNSLLNKSLKQWEMYSGYVIEELPYLPNVELTNDQQERVKSYCAYDVKSTKDIFFSRCFETTNDTFGCVTFKAYRELVSLYPIKPCRFDITVSRLAEGIIYQTAQRLPAVTRSALHRFSFDDFNVNDIVKTRIKDIIAIAENPKYLVKADIKKAIDDLPPIDMINMKLGRGGCHYVKKGLHRKVAAFDVSSMYPSVILHWNLLKSSDALKQYRRIRDHRLSIKHDPQQAVLNDAEKRVLNAFSGAMSARGHTAYDPYARDALCYISQMLMCEAIQTCPDKENIIEVNTDSIFVVGHENIVAMRASIPMFIQKYEITFEESKLEQVYFRDVNNYAVYDENGIFLYAKGGDNSDMLKKNSNKAVINTLFASLVMPQRVELPLADENNWQDYVYKYHKSAASVYATIGDEPMAHKNYYFLWTTKDCPKSEYISFSRDKIDSHNGSIKMRRGVWSLDSSDLKEYIPWIDYKQYNMDLDEMFDLWAKPEFIQNRITDKAQRRYLKKHNQFDLIL